MNYTFDRTAVLVRPERERDDDEQWATVTQPASLGALDFSDTQPVPMVDAEALMHARADAAMAACQAPRVPRRRSPILSADSPDGTSRQGRDIPRPTSPVDSIDEDLEYHRLWWYVMIVLFAIACAFALAGCGGDDCNEDSATVQPVECAASGCAK